MCIRDSVWIDWRMAVSMFAALPLALLVLWASTKAQRKLSGRQIQAKINAGNRLEEYLQGCLLYTSIRQTWEKLHPEQDKQKAKQASPTPKPTATATPKPSVPNEARQKPQPFVLRNNPVYEDYTDYKPNSLPTEFEHDGKTYKRYLPEDVYKRQSLCLQLWFAARRCP